jgi:hypothetical protein
VELTEALLEKHGEEWIEQHGNVILDQWETMLSLGILSLFGQNLCAHLEDIPQRDFAKPILDNKR